MHLIDHLTDVQLNEYLDNETPPDGRALIESHLVGCTDCTARLLALQALFNEIESLPELELTHSFAVRFMSQSSLPAPQFPRWLTLTVTLQAAVALIAMSLTVPIISQYLTPYLQSIPIPSLKDVAIELQMHFVMWIQSIQSFQFPTVPTGTFTLPIKVSTGILSAVMIGLFLLWLVGNWWLIRRRPNSVL